MRLVKHCDLPKPPASASSLQSVEKFLHNQTSMMESTSGSSPAQKAVSGQSMAYDISIKDSIVIGFMLGLWLYSIVLMFKAWSKILNFSDDQAGRPEKAAFLWKWLMEHIKNKKEGDSSSNNSSRKASNTAMMMECSVGATGEVFIATEATQEAAGTTILPTESMPLQASIDPTEDNDVVAVVHHNDAEEKLTKERSSLHCGKSCIGEESYQVVSCCPIEHTASSSSSTSTKTATSNKRMLQRQAKSLGQYDEFKAAALTTDLSLVQERLAVLETNELACHDQPPELPPRDYFSYQEEML